MRGSSSPYVPSGAEWTKKWFNTLVYGGEKKVKRRRWRYLSQFQIEGLCVVPLAEGPEEPVVGGADSDSSLQQEANWLLHLGDDKVHRRRHVHELVFEGEK